MALPIARPDAQPLMASRGLRGATAIAIVVGGLLLVGVMILISVFAASPLLAGGSVLVGLCLIATASVAEGGWHGGTFGAVERVAVALLALICAGVVVFSVGETVTQLLQLRTLGTAPSHNALPLAVAAFALLALTVMAVTLPLGGDGGRRWVRRTAVATAAGALLAAAGGAVAYATPSDAGCGSFDFEPARWQAALAHRSSGDASFMAEAIERCGVVTPGMSRVQAQALLGPRNPSDDSWSWMIGDPAGFSFGEYLAVSLTADGSRIATIERYVD